MKILICSQEYYPRGSGIANVAYYITKNLKKEGIECKILSPDGPDIKIDYGKTINRLGGLGLIFFWNKVAEYINKNKNEYDLIWIHNPLFIKKIQAQNIISTVHTTYVKYYEIYKKFPIPLFHKLYYLIMRFIERMCYRKNKFLSTVVSSELINELVKLGLEPNKIRYIHNGADIKKFYPKKSQFRLDIPQNAIILLFVGRFDYQKEPMKLIRTFAEIENKDKNVYLVLAGEGILFSKTKDEAKKLGIKNCIFLGKVPHENLVDLYNKAHFYMMSSCYEGQPLTITEAMSCGLPCILNNIPNLIQIVKESKLGLITNFNNEEEAANQIIDYIKKIDINLEKRKVREYAEKNLDWEKITELYLSFFQEKLRNQEGL